MNYSTVPLQPGNVYHIWSHAVSNDNLFKENENYRFFLSRYFSYTKRILSTHAYCLMPNHFHFMVKVLNEESIINHPEIKELKEEKLSNIPKFISQQLGNLHNSYTKSFNVYYSRRGSLFERPFGRSLISSENYFTQLVICIHMNPVTHGFVREIQDWPYSSWHSYDNNENDQLSKESVLNWFGGLEYFVEAHMNMKDVAYEIFDL